MNYKANIRPAWVVLVLLLGFTIVFSMARRTDSTPAQNTLQDSEKEPSFSLTKFKNSTQNENCLKCHGQSKYTYENKESGKLVNKRMYSELIIPRKDFYVSNHREFKCTDCHSEDYSTFPHAGNLRMEAKANCIDCHGGDEKYAKFQFEKIDTAFMASVHSQKHSADFTCWMCHNPHFYKINARTNENRKENLNYHHPNRPNCHRNIKNYPLITEKQKPNLLVKHEWLPNQASHFTNVRCIECHARNEDTLIVAHHVVAKNLAVRKCESCHSKNSILYASLFKYQIQENIKKGGLIKGLFFSETATIGPDQNNSLNILSFVILGFTLLVILIHAALRIKKSN